MTGSVGGPLSTTSCSAADGITTVGDLLTTDRDSALPRLRATMRRLSLGLPALLPSCLALAAGLGLTPVIASGQSIGAYTPPHTWPERPRRFDLIHQRIAISVDWSHLAIAGQVQTTVVATTAHRHGAARRRPPDDHRSATDLKGEEAQVRGRHHARHRAPAEAPRSGRHGAVHPGLHRCPGAGTLLRAAEPRGLDPGRGDRDQELGADLRLPQRQGDLGIPGDGRLRHVGPLQREPGRRDARPRAASAGSGTGSRRSPRRPTSTRWSSGRSPCCTTSGGAVRWTTGWRPTRSPPAGAPSARLPR